jgi:hypothetical protein
MNDMVNKPPHYNQNGIECITAIEAATGKNFKYYLQGNVLKYLWRFDYKGDPVNDLRKAEWYLNRLIKEVTIDELGQEEVVVVNEDTYSNSG